MQFLMALCTDLGAFCGAVCRSATRPGPRRKRSGFALVEMLIAVSLFMASFFLIMDIWPRGGQAAQQARSVLVATHLAEQQMELAYAQGFEIVASTSGDIDIAQVVAGVQQAATRFHYSVTVNPVTSTLKDVQIQVQWREGGIDRHADLETLVCRRY